MESIGVIYSPFTSLENMPIQPKGAPDVEGTIIIKDNYVDGLKDLNGFSHIYLIYHFHKAQKTSLTVTPFLDTFERGVFATRSPLRPNHIGLSIVQLLRVEGPKLSIKGIDVLNETPLLDIKPYIAKFDEVNNSLSGWMAATEQEVSDKRSDNRFI
jgi:tRNA-Thr(GGU) m(6)t(6)A37 methyltransferase TsaA